MSDFANDEYPDDGRPPLDSYLELDPETFLLGRYKVINLLGAGRNSTVYLTHDTSVETSPLRAVKILTSRATSFEFDENETSYELEVLQIIKEAAQRVPEDPGHRHILQFLDSFTLTSPYGDHLALVTNVLGHHIGELQDHMANRKVPPVAIRHLCRQLLQALAFLHDGCKVVHTDIKQDNVILDDFGAKSTVLTRVSVSLADFGEAVHEHGDHRKLIQPTTLRSPEVIAGLEWDTKADIWNLGCFIFELLAGTRLFVSKETRDKRGKLLATSKQFHFAHIYSHLQLPHESEEMLNEYFSRRGVATELFNHNGTRRVKLNNPMPLEEILRHYDVYDPGWLEFLQSMLRILPKDRLSARELLSHRWLSVHDPDPDSDEESDVEHEVQGSDGEADRNDAD